MGSRVRSICLLAVVGCATQGPVAALGGRVDPNAGKDCVAHCLVLGMELAAVVIIMGRTGCVCEPRDRAGSSKEGGGAVAGATAIVSAIEQQQTQQQRVQPQPPPTPVIAPARVRPPGL